MSQTARDAAGVDDREILFVLGGARSGTTYVNGILDEWFGFGMGPEGAFVADYYRRRHQFGDLHDDANLDRAVADIVNCTMLRIMRERWAPPHRADVTREMIRREVRERSIGGLIYAVFAAVAAIQNRPHVGNKWPEYWRHLDTLDDMYGQRARYLFVLRDGRDVALSTMQQPWGEKTSYACARAWRAAVEAVEDFKRRKPAAQVCTVRYEDVLAEPARVWGDMEAFLGLSPDPEKRQRFIAQVEANPLRENSSKWRTRMNERDLRVFEALAGPALAAHGYELALPAAGVSAIERAYFATCELARKVYWTVRTRMAGET